MLKIIFLKEKFAVAKMKNISSQQISYLLNKNSLCCFFHSKDETSIICEEKSLVDFIECERSWSALKIVGPISFEAHGILNTLLTPIVSADVSVLVISTFNTDYIFFKSYNLPAVKNALKPITKNIICD